MKLRLILILSALLFSAPASAQFGDIGTSDQPVSITADDGIEWNRDAKFIVARKNAQATQGDFFISADTLTAHYVELEEGGNPDVIRVVASGSVYAKTAEAELVGDQLEFFVKEERAILTGSLLVMETAEGRVSARDRITYDGLNLIAEAIGDAQVSQGTSIVSAPRLIAYFYPDSQGSSSGGQGLSGNAGRVRLVEAQGGVAVTDGENYAEAERGKYDPGQNIAILEGSVRVTQGPNQLVGDFAEYNLNTGKAEVKSNGGGVFILLTPNSVPRQ